MKDVAFVIVIVLAGLLLLFLTLLQAASSSLKVALFLSVCMGLVCSFITSMIAFTVDETLNSDALYKIMFISQLAAGLVTVMLTMQPCFRTRNWQRSINEAIFIFLSNIAGEQSSESKSIMLQSLKTNDSNSFGNHNSNPMHSNSLSQGLFGINLANISYSEPNTSNELL